MIAFFAQIKFGSAQLVRGSGMHPAAIAETADKMEKGKRTSIRRAGARPHPKRFFPRRSSKYSRISLRQKRQALPIFDPGSSPSEAR
jgi:hypothetical protein